MNIWHDIDPAEITPEDFTAVVEIPRGSSCKYELDKKTGLVRLDRVLYTPRTTPPTTALFRAHSPMTATRWMCWCCAPSPSTR